jgi:FkbM family methyltransferase
MYLLEYIRAVYAVVRECSNWPEVLAGIIRMRLNVSDEKPFLVKTRKGSVVLCGSSKEAAAGVKSCLIYDEYNFMLLAKTLSFGGTVIDVGANVGAFSLALNELRPDLQFVLYEPSEGALYFLEQNIKANNLGDKVKIFCEAVTDSDGWITFWAGGSSSVFSSIYQQKLDAVPVKVKSVSLKTVVDRVGGPIELLKLDCEGAEYDIIVGSNPRLFEAVRAIIFEYHTFILGDAKVHEMLSTLQSLGFYTVWERHDRYLGMAYLRKIVKD